MQKILQLSIPITVANLLSLGSVFCNIKILGNATKYNLYIFTLFLPLNFWIISLQESLRVQAMTVSSLAACTNNFNLITPQIGNLLLVNFIGLSLPSFVLLFFPNLFAKILLIKTHSDLSNFTLFANCMLISNYIMSAALLIIAIFNGINRQNIAAGLITCGVVSCVALNDYLTKHTNLAIYSLPAAIFVSYIIIFLFSIYYLTKNNILHWPLLKNSLARNNFIRLRQLTLPIWLTYFIISIALIAFTRLMSTFGKDSVTGFGLAYRIQTFLLLPAISIGIAIGILINKEKHKNVYPANILLIEGFIICTIIYCFIIYWVYTKSQTICALLTNDIEIIKYASYYLKTISPSFVGLAITLCFCMVLDQVGFGLQSACFTAFIFFIEIIITLIFLQYWHTEYVFYWTVALGNTLSGLLTLMLIKKFNLQVNKKLLRN